MTVLYWAAALLVSALAGLQSPATIEGVVIEAGTERPLAGVQVKLSSTLPSTTTNAEGRFTLPAAGVGRYQLAAALTGFVFLTPTQAGVWVQLSGGERIRNVR